MSEKELDSSINEYEEINKPSEYIKQQQWEMAIGLQRVDNLKPSKYLEKLLEENIIGKLSLEQVKKELRTYYIEKEKKNEVNKSELECDFVSTRIVELLQENKFKLLIIVLFIIIGYFVFPQLPVDSLLRNDKLWLGMGIFGVAGLWGIVIHENRKNRT